MRLSFAAHGAWLVAGASLLSCGSDDAFLSLADLCPARVSDICSACNGGCGAPRDPAACEAAGMQACQAEQDMLTAESSLRYDSVAAARVDSAARTAIRSSGSAPPLASYFEGGLAIGSACERGAQCVSGACTGQPLTCSEPTPSPLCP